MEYTVSDQALGVVKELIRDGELAQALALLDSMRTVGRQSWLHDQREREAAGNAEYMRRVRSPIAMAH